MCNRDRALFQEVADKHAPLENSVRKRKAPWIYQKLKALMAQSDQMKNLAMLLTESHTVH